MFDAETVALIEAAPRLDGVDPERLAQQLTEAYTQVVSARVAVRSEGHGGRDLPGGLQQTLIEMRRLASTHEALVATLPDRTIRAAAAFVAGAAHHVGALSERLSSDGSPPSYLSAGSVSPDVSAVLLFLIAEAPADAAEMARGLSTVSEDPVEAALLAAIQALARGRIVDLLAIPVPPESTVADGDRTQQAVRALYLLTLLGVRELAAGLAGVPSPNGRRLEVVTPSEIFGRVRSLSAESARLSDEPTATLEFLYPGPFHLATLLLRASEDLLASAAVDVPAPEGTDKQKWRATMMRLAASRPYLWRNHRKAIDSGYLAAGVSAVVSFPTGAGKSTIAELKVVAALLAGRRVVCLAPTLALVDQTRRTLAQVVPEATIEGEHASEWGDDTDDHADIMVLTPERALALLSFNADAFVRVGLVVFDECHLLHPDHASANRRALDAMLCVLTLAQEAPQADFLLISAMMSNSTELAGWLGELTGRPCVDLALTWKPTRQVRGCVLYQRSDVVDLRQRISRARASRTTKGPPAALKREMEAQPFGFFSLRQTWLTQKRRDYALVPLLERPVPLAIGASNDSWYPAPNGNEVAARLATATSGAGLKTLVFASTVPFANSIVRLANTAHRREPWTLTETELRLHRAASDELGSATRLYLDVVEGGVTAANAACHHGLLLPFERDLHESLFRRRDGLGVVVATSTLAQGMNLPSEVVIIQGDARFDADDMRMKQLEAHELLNAAGRAGRAGEASYGMVIVVPSKVMDFDDDSLRIHRHWEELRAVFAQSDQCVEIDDPLSAVLDEIHLLAVSEDARYLLRRLPIGGRDDPGGPDGQARRLIGSSLAAYRARGRGDETWVAARTDAAITARAVDPAATGDFTAADRIAARAGVDVAVIRDLQARLARSPIVATANTLECRDWMMAWLRERPEWVPTLIRDGSLEGWLGAPYKALASPDQGRFALSRISRVLAAWMSGQTLEALEQLNGTAADKLGKCEGAREFVLRVLPGLSFVLGLLGPVAREGESGTTPTLAIDTLGACVREGMESPGMLAFRYARRWMSRIAIHRDYPLVEGHLPGGAVNERFRDLSSQVRAAVTAWEAEANGG